MTSLRDGLPPYSVVGPNGHPRFAAPLLGRELVDEFPAAKDGGGHVYVYADDRWRRGGEDFYRAKIRERLGNSWKGIHGNETVAWIATTMTRLDVKPAENLVRVANGIVRVTKVVKLLEPGLEPLTPVTLPVRYVAAAKCPAFRKFVGEVMDPETRRIAQELMGYLLVPDNSAQKAFLLKGSGGNGKSVWMSVLRALLGPENVSARELSALSGEDKFSTADLYGKLANLCADISARELASSATLRAITGGDVISAQRKYGHGFEFVPFVRLVFSANKFPPIANPTNPMWDRWLVLPFNNRFRDTAAQDKDLTAKLTTPEELSGILNYALEGLVRYRRQGGFSTSKASTGALAEFKEASDAVRMFISEVIPEPGFYARPQTFEKYKAWAHNSGYKQLSKGSFFSRMDEVLGDAYKSGNDRGWRVK
jgi:putative DNA primase/helicase